MQKGSNGTGMSKHRTSGTPTRSSKFRHAKLREANTEIDDAVARRKRREQNRPKFDSVAEAIKKTPRK